MPVALHHEITGQANGPVLLLGGSLGTTGSMWDPQVRVLGETLRVVAFDHRGHGRSPVPPAPYDIADLGRDVVALLDRLETGKASYCGISIGGMVGMWLAANAPERIDRLILISTAAHLPPASAWAERAAKVRAAGTVAVVADAVVERWLTPAYRARHPEVRDRLRAMLAATPADGYAACCGAVERMDLRSDLARIRAPTLVIGGEQDLAAPPAHARAIASAIPGARLELLSPAAHLASVERADAVNALILDHLGKGAS